MELSVIVPVYNEADNIGRLMSEIEKHLSGIDFELIIVDDKSTDETINNAIRLKQSNTKLIALDKNYGQSTAIKSGLDSAKGKYVALLDGDLQNDPRDLVVAYELIEKKRVDMVQGFRADRHDSLSKKIPNKLANFFIRRLFNVTLQDVGCSLKVFNRSLCSTMIQFNGFHRYIPLIAHIQQFSILEMKVNHLPRIAGKSKYGIERIFPVVWDLLYLKIAPFKRSRQLTYTIEKTYE